MCLTSRHRSTIWRRGSMIRRVAFIILRAQAGEKPAANASGLWEGRSARPRADRLCLRGPAYRELRLRTMPHPFHGSNCSTRTYPWRCPECAARVFVFCCSCGSWVMFDDLGPPWPKHSCFDHRYRQLVATVKPILDAGADPRAAMFSPFEELRAMLDPDRLSTRSTKGELEGRPAQQSAGITRPIHTTKRMDPIPGEKEFFIGVVRDLSADTRHLSSLYDALGDIGRSLFGLPSKSKALQVTVVDAGGEPNESYTGVVSRDIVARDIRPGVMVGVTMEAKVAPSASTWVIVEISAL